MVPARSTLVAVYNFLLLVLEFHPAHRHNFDGNYYDSPVPIIAA